MSRKTPVKMTKEFEKEICEAIVVSTEGLRILCEKNPHWPSVSHIRLHLFYDDSFKESYARAKSQQVESLVDEALNICFDESRDIYDDGKGRKRYNNTVVNRDRLKIDTIKWGAAKLMPKKYGDWAEKDANKATLTLSEIEAYILNKRKENAK